ncbi:HSP7D [Acrasis kona]|uniref:HSP7D n=1 Tax=Acrasis kona TaxID=1008807 RepID=A0AAW2YSC0_9EUKA
MAKGKKVAPKNQKQDAQTTQSTDEVKVFHNAIAIDFGDDSCTVGYFSHKEGKVIIIQNEDGDFQTPSVLSFTQEELFVGKPAVHNEARNAKNTVYNIKSLLAGGGAHDTAYPFQIEQTEEGVSVQVQYKGESRTYQLYELVSLVLAKMKSIAEFYLSKKVTRAVITVPKYFDEAQRAVVIKASENIDLEVIQLLDDPIAAAICYGLDEVTKDAGDVTALVVDVGRHTSRTAIVKSHNTTGCLAVVSNNLTWECGGDILDDCIVQFLLTDIESRYFSDSNERFRESVTNSLRVMARLRLESERCKLILSQSNTASIELDSLFDGVDYSYTLNRARLDNLIAEPVKALLDLVKRTIAGEKSKIDRILLVGASAAIPQIQESIKALNIPNNCDKLIDEPIMSGAAIQAYLLRTRIDHRIEHKSQLENVGDDVSLVDERVPVTSTSIGLQANGGLTAVIVPKGTSLPHTATHLVSNATPNKDGKLLIKVVQGERPFAKDNNLVNFPQYAILCGNEAQDRGQQHVELIVNVSAEGKLSFKAVDSETKQPLKLAPTSEPYTNGVGAYPSVQDILDDAEKNVDSDKVRVSGAEARSKLETYVYRMRAKNIDDESARKLSDDTIKWIQENEEGTHQDYLMKLREYHGAIPK